MTKMGNNNNNNCVHTCNWRPNSHTVQVQEGLLQVREEARRRRIPLDWWWLAASQWPGGRAGGEEVAGEGVQLASSAPLKQR